jgi:hypothetical protein
VLPEAEKRGDHSDGAVGEVYEKEDYEPSKEIQATDNQPASGGAIFQFAV